MSPTAQPVSFARTVTTRMRVNGRAMAVTHEARVSLLDLLRERLQLTGTKKGCNEGACGVCTVLVDGRRVNGCMIRTRRRPACLSRRPPVHGDLAHLAPHVVRALSSLGRRPRVGREGTADPPCLAL